MGLISRVSSRTYRNFLKMAPSSNSSSTKSGLAQAWLLLYNVGQVAGWSSIGYSIIVEMWISGNYKILYHIVEKQLLIFQTAAVLEILHAATGLVKSNPILTTFQVFSRVIVLWGIVYPIVKVQINLGCALLLFAWTVTEMIRYSYYSFTLLGYLPSVLNYLRYTLFIVLYPIGVTGELLCIYRALPIVKETDLFSLHLPNKWNFSFEYYYVLFGTFPLYVVLFPQLYFHMFKQRGKALGSKPSQSKKVQHKED